MLRIGREEPDGREDYIYAVLTDEEEIYDAIGRLRQVYPNLCALDFDNSRYRRLSEQTAAGDVSQKGPAELFSEFYQVQNNNELSPEQYRIMERIFQQAGGGDCL